MGVNTQTTNIKLKTLTAVQRLTWSFKNFPLENIALTTSGGETSALLPHIVGQVVQQQKIPFPQIIFIDTGFYPDTTLQMVNYLQNKGFPIKTYCPHLSPSEINNLYPDWPFTPSFKTVKNIIKQEPLDRAFKDLNVKLWISGIMSEETKERQTSQILEYDPNQYIYRLHPILDWTKSQALTYLKENSLPINSHHFDITKGPNQNLECGIHNFSKN